MPVAVNTFRRGNLEMDYAILSGGPRSLVILPGMSLKSVLQSAEAVAGQYKPLAGDYTIYIPDRRKDFPETYSVSEMAGDTAVLLEALGIGNACIFGVSQGAMMAMELAVRHPSLVGCLAVCSTYPRPSDRGRQVMDEWIRLCDEGDPKALNMDIYRRVFSPAFFKRYENALERMSEEQVSAEEMRRYRIMALATKEFDIYDDLTGIKCPVYVSGVEDDTVLGGDGTLEIAGRLHCTPVVIPGRGHCFFDEDPGFPYKLKAFFDNN